MNEVRKRKRGKVLVNIQTIFTTKFVQNFCCYLKCFYSHFNTQWMRAKNVVWDKKIVENIYFTFSSEYLLQKGSMYWNDKMQKDNYRKNILYFNVSHLHFFFIYTNKQFFDIWEDYLINSMSNIQTHCHFSKHHLYNILDNNGWFMINNMKSIYWYIAGDDSYDDQYVIILQLF